jgi:hypothetical protein
MRPLQRPTASHRARWCSVLLGAFVLCAGVRTRADELAVTITDLDFEEVRTPRFSERSVREPRPDDEWFQLLVEYEVEGDRDAWVDEVELEWYVLLNSPRAGRLLLHKTITYADIPEGDHLAVVYIRPRFIQRYAESGDLDKRDLKVLITLKANGTVRDRYHYPSRKPRSEWWRPVSAEAVIKDGELLARTETPFAPLDWGVFEHIKSSGTGRTGSETTNEKEK